MIDTQLTVLIPAFNEENTIRSLVKRCLQFTDQLIVVDDGSTDNTVERIKDLPITILRNTLNRGKDASLLRGFAYTQNFNTQAVITLDADDQHNPNDIPYFIEAMQKYPDRIIIGARTINTKSAPRIRLFANRAADFFISWAAGHRIIDTQSGFRLYPNKIIPKTLRKSSRHGQFVFESKILIDATRKGCTPVSLPIASYYPKNARDSYFRPIIDTGKIMALITWKIFSRGLCLKGLYATLFQTAERFERSSV